MSEIIVSFVLGTSTLVGKFMCLFNVAHLTHCHLGPVQNITCRVEMIDLTHFWHQIQSVCVGPRDEKNYLGMSKDPCFLLVFISCPCSFKVPVPQNSRMTSREKIILRIYSIILDSSWSSMYSFKINFNICEIFQMIDYLMLDLWGRKSSKNGFRFFDLLPATWSKFFDGSS